MDQNNNNHKPNDNNNEDKINPLFAGIVGAAAGAAAYALTKKENQAKLKKAAADMKVAASQKLQDIKGGLATQADKMGDKLKEAADKTRQDINKDQTPPPEPPIPEEEL